MSYFTPNIVINKITDIDEKTLKNLDIKAVLLDIDNTLSPHGAPLPYDGIINWLRIVNNIGIDTLIISNNKEERVAKFANNINLKYISDARKPLRYGFNKAINLFNVEKKNILVIGDQIFTDVLGANLAGTKSALVEPIDKNEPILIKIKRIFEFPFRIFIKYKNKRGRIF